jgi:phosphopantothenoylcysteine decarboxylase/phosphopantothenoylcysteine decarboxylase/phosphopantothenate--cysteine ligase
MEKSIVVAVTGSIAAYKACDLVRNLRKSGHRVTVLMTENARKFVSLMTFETLSGEKAFSTSWDEGMLHIDAKNLAAVFAVVPATANMLAKMAHGIADDLVCATYLAVSCPVLVAPAMNPGMFNHPATQANLVTLKERGAYVAEPESGEVICGDVGQGKMASVAAIERMILDLYPR